jgi:heat shock protein HslJ
VLARYGDALNPAVVEEGTVITAVFSPDTGNRGTISGNATCNDYSTSYTIDGDQISFGTVAGTRMLAA